MVRELLDAVELVAKNKITAAYNEGYKQGLLDAYPDAAYWQSLSASMSDAAKKSASPGWGTAALIGGISLVVGFIGGQLFNSFVLAK